MKSKILIRCLVFLLAIACSSSSYAQHGNGGNKPHGNKGGAKGGNHGNGKPNNGYRNGGNNQYNKNNYNHHPAYLRSRYHPQVVVQYHPHWGHQRNYNRRWVYFPNNNFYWDNWRQMYVYRNANRWYANAVAPPFILNLNLETEQQYELDENDDDLDNIYQSNSVHYNLYFRK